MGDAKASSSENVKRRVLFVSAGASHTVALLSGDSLCSWGRGEDGQLGHGDPDERHLPTIISALEDCDISSITCGADHTTACSDSTKTVYSWGWLWPAAISSIALTSPSTLFPGDFTSPCSDPSANERGIFQKDPDGYCDFLTVPSCRSSMGDFGRLGHGNSSDLFIPQPIKALQGLEIKQIACGDSHCLAITIGGEVHSWGRNQNGQLGLGNTEDSLIPCKVQAFKGIAVKMLAAGAEHTAAVTENGKLYGWGWGRYGNLGLGDRTDRLVPGEVAAVAGEKMKMVACGWRHTIAVAESGNLYTFGWSKYGQLGHGDFQDHLVPHQVAGLKNKKISLISGGWRHTVALDEEGQLYGWGWNKFGQVGVGNTEDQNSPKLVKALSDQAVLYPGWPYNAQVDITDGTNHPLDTEKVKCGRLQRVTQVSCGWRHTLAITERGNVYSWGRGTSGQLGHGDALDRSVPKLIELLSADGLACQQIKSSRLANTTAANWISPSERYAVVPDETMRTLARRLHQTANVEGELVVPTTREAGTDASVPDTDTKRLRTGL